MCWCRHTDNLYRLMALVADQIHMRSLGTEGSNVLMKTYRQSIQTNGSCCWCSNVLMQTYRHLVQTNGSCCWSGRHGQPKCCWSLPGCCCKRDRTTRTKLGWSMYSLRGSAQRDGLQHDKSTGDHTEQPILLYSAGIGVIMMAFGLFSDEKQTNKCS